MVLPCLDPDSGIRVDVIFSVSPYEQQALQRVRRVKMGETDVCFVSPEDLIIHKVIAGRPRDIEDVKTVLLKQSGLDLVYLRTWLQRFSTELGEPFDARFESTLRDIG